jgi:hypothetical protein
LEECHRTVLQQELLVEDLELRVREVQQYLAALEKDFLQEHTLENLGFKERLGCVQRHPEWRSPPRSDVWDTVRLLRVQLEEETRVNRELADWRVYLREHLERFTHQNSSLSRLRL